MTKAPTMPKAAEAVTIYQLSLEEAVAIVQRGYPLTECELQKMKPAKTYDAKTYFECVRPDLTRPFDTQALTAERPACIPLPPALARAVFPTTVQFAPVFCFCSGLVFEIVPAEVGGVPGQRLVLKCEYFCPGLAS